MHHRGQLMQVERMLGLVPHLTRQFQERMAQAQTQGATKQSGRRCRHLASPTSRLRFSEGSSGTTGATGSTRAGTPTRPTCGPR